ncbi:MAG: ubiquinone biosynthesis protein UbiA [Bacteroidetes bacterium]|nr:MAG: ubiquinone biosynthesis protein UbiA [Bacteroidota bacterium]
MLAYLRLFRWPNLAVVALTQYLVRYAIILPLLSQGGIEPALSHIYFALLVLTTLLITAAGYAINDYFDLRADRINKPDKIVLGKHISRRTAIFYHSLFNVAGVVLGVILSLVVGSWQLAFIFIIIPFLLWMYSIRYKKKYFIGNFIVAVLAAFVVAIVWVFEFQALNGAVAADPATINSISFLVRSYAFFAFLTTLVREIIKDAEDIRGDAKTGCKTIPIVSGMGTTKRIIIFFNIALIALIIAMQVYLLRRDFDLLFVYLIFAVQVPFILMINKTINAAEKSDYNYLSKFAKLTMLGGVLSMVILYFYILEGFSIL